MRQAQRGGTFLGIILGVVIGLGGALAVAIYVTKVPVPFMNKNQPRKAEQDAAEALKNKNWDPNAPLYGKNPARPAASAASATGAASAPAAAAPGAAASAKGARPADTAPAVAAPAQPAKPEARAASAADPLGDLAKSRSATVDPFTYLVQAGAFRTPEDAEAQRAKLGLMGVEAKITEREQSGRTVYRVRVGPFDNKEAADRMKERIDAGGLEATLVRVQR
jgi:cell division protein FtsN